jgi:hypothetical protein
MSKLAPTACQTAAMRFAVQSLHRLQSGGGSTSKNEKKSSASRNLLRREHRHPGAEAVAAVAAAVEGAEEELPVHRERRRASPQPHRSHHLRRSRHFAERAATLFERIVLEEASTQRCSPIYAGGSPLVFRSPLHSTSGWLALSNSLVMKMMALQDKPFLAIVEDGGIA